MPSEDIDDQSAVWVYCYRQDFGLIAVLDHIIYTCMANEIAAPESIRAQNLFSASIVTVGQSETRPLV